MSRILKRPMFMKGGSVGQGIMNKVERKMYNKGTSFEDIYKTIQPLYQQAVTQKRDDDLANFLIRGGMNLISGSGKEDQSLLQELSSAYRGPTEEAIKAKSQRDVLRMQGDLAALGAAAKIASTKKDKGFAAQTFEEQVKNKQNFYKGTAITGSQAIKFSRLAPKEVRAERQLGTKFFGVVDRIKDAVGIAKTSPEGTVFLDAESSSFYMVKDNQLIPVTFAQAIEFNTPKASAK
jgi:hypothetical protein